MATLKELIPLFENLTGSKANRLDEASSNIKIFNSKGIGYSQFNEIILLLGFKRVSAEFFQYLSDGRYTYKPETSIKSQDHLEIGVTRFIKLALLFYGNIKFAYKELANDSDLLFDKIFESLPNDPEIFKERHEPLRNIIEIPPDKTYFLGYLIEREIKKRIKADPYDQEALKLEAERKKYIKIGESNQVAYLSSDHLDVYVATSMRLPHEFIFVNKVIKEIFNSQKIKELNLRCFDPTQAYCVNRIDKGLSEALMLKTALCTIYLAQESETLGKDSELASTLAQGKAVIAYVPIGDRKYVDELLDNLKQLNEGRKEKEIIFEQLKVYDPSLAWEDDKVRRWLDNPESAQILEMKKLLYKLAEEYYDKRANTLKEDHPLGIQVNLKSGVANGVLVVRSIEDCINLMRNIVLNEMEYCVDPPDPSKQKGYIYLKEKISDCIFRLKTGNSLLTNTFWNFYTPD